MKITHIAFDAVHVNHRGDWVFVHVHTDSDVQGLGELRAGKNYGNRVAAVRSLGELLVGKDPRRIEAVFAEFTRTDRSWDELCALSAVEQALWDILGQSLGVPLPRRTLIPLARCGLSLTSFQRDVAPAGTMPG